MDDNKPTVLLIFGTFFLGGCGGHPMRPKLNLKDKGQMSTLNEYTDNGNFFFVRRLIVRTDLRECSDLWFHDFFCPGFDARWFDELFCRRKFSAILYQSL